MKKSFRFDFEDYIAGTAFLNRKEKGSYVDLLCCQAGKGRLTLQNIKDILNGDFDCWEKLSSKFIEENGMYYNRKLESVMTVKHKKTVEEIIQDRNKIEQHLKETKLKFYNDCKPYLEKYPKEMLRKFYNYWTEMNKSGTKLRFELQQTFEISKRLATWAGKDKEFIEQKPKTYNEMLKLSQTDPGIWKSYQAVKQEGEKQAIFIPIKL